MKTKKICILFLIVCFFMISVAIASCSFSGGNTESLANQETETSQGADSGSGDTSESDFDQLLESEGFLEVFDSFYYPDAEIKEVKQVESDQNLLYILLETTENSKKVEEYYKEKQVQSIWSRAVIFEERSEGIEEEFLEDESENIPIYKFTYTSNDKDKVVNVLVKGLEENRTRIMIIYWNLQ